MYIKIANKEYINVDSRNTLTVHICIYTHMQTFIYTYIHTYRHTHIYIHILHTYPGLFLPKRG